MKTEILVEALDLSEAQINAESRILRGVVLIRAGMSKNRRFYSESLLRESASVFEGAKAYVNHAPQGNDARSVRDISGWYSGVTYENGALRADRHFARTQAGQDVWVIAEDIVSGRAPASLAGLSINAVGQGVMQRFDDGDALNVESISAALSVDDVSEAAAGGAYLLTAGMDGDLTAPLLRAMTFDEWTAARPDFVNRLHDDWRTLSDIESSELLLEAQVLLTQVEAERNTAIQQAQAIQRELEIEHLLIQVDLPPVWAKMLREQLCNSESGEWTAIIENERQKARSAGHRVAIDSAPQQVQQPLTIVPRHRRVPLNLNNLRAPEELAALVREIQEERLAHLWRNCRIRRARGEAASKRRNVCPPCRLPI
jgi:hypothetical protein